MGKLQIEYARGKNPNSRNGFQKGHKPFVDWNGRKHTPETIAKQKAVKLGIKPSQETKDKMSKAQKGRLPKNINEIAGWNKGTKGLTSHTLEWRKEQSKLKMGSNNPAWKGGKVKENTRIRFTLDYMLWRDAVLERDNYTCNKCFKYGGKLHAHHIKSFKEYPELRFSIQNGVVLCRDCHMTLHGLNKKAVKL